MPLSRRRRQICRAGIALALAACATGRAVVGAPPVYPAALLAAAVEGDVVLDVWTDRDGRVAADSVRIAPVARAGPSAGLGFARAASAAAAGWRFPPAGGRGGWRQVTVAFRIVADTAAFHSCAVGPLVACAVALPPFVSHGDRTSGAIP